MDRVDVDVIGDGRSHRRECTFRVAQGVGSHQPQVARRHLEVEIPGHGTEHRHADGFAGIAENGGVSIGSDLVEDHPGGPGLGTERRIAVDKGGDGLAISPCVDDENHRCAELGCDVRSRPEPGHAVWGDMSDPAIEQTHNALDHRDISPRASMRIERTDTCGALEVRVEIPAGPACCEAMKSRVDEVRADLERCHLPATSHERRHKPCRHGRLSIPGGWRADNHGARNGGHYHSIPR